MAVDFVYKPSKNNHEKDISLKLDGIYKQFGSYNALTVISSRRAYWAKTDKGKSK
jgi:hypothetical protein